MSPDPEGSPESEYPDEYGGLLRGMEAWHRFVTLIPEDGAMTAMRHTNLTDQFADVEVIHRDFPGVVFDLTFSKDGRVRRFGMRPYDWSDDVLEAMPELGARLLRSVPLGEMQALAAQSISEMASQTKRFRGWVESIEANHKPGRRGRPDRFYAELAADYCSALGSATPVKDLAEAVNYSESQIRSLLYEARRRDLLTETPSGKAGGSLTDKARELLAATDEGDT